MHRMMKVQTNTCIGINNIFEPVINVETKTDKTTTACKYVGIEKDISVDFMTSKKMYLLGNSAVILNVQLLNEAQLCLPIPLRKYYISLKIGLMLHLNAWFGVYALRM